MYETRGVLAQKLADVFVPVPDEGQTTDNVHLSAIHFASDKTVSSTPASVGCGVRLDLGHGTAQWLTLNGEVTCSVAWVSSPDGEKVVIPSGKALYKRGVLTTNRRGQTQLKNILDKSKLKAMAQKPGGDTEDVDTTPEERPRDELLEFCTEAEIERNPRFRLLQLRSSGAAGFRNFGTVPLLPNEYSVSLIENIYAREQREEVFPSYRDPIEARQAKMSALMRQVREDVLRKVYESHAHRVLEDVVIEERIPIFGSLGFGLMKLAKKHRSLRPSRRERRKVTGQSMAAADAEILVTVLRATNVPVRKDLEVSKVATDMGNECQVRPFVEVMFQHKTART